MKKSFDETLLACLSDVDEGLLANAYAVDDAQKLKSYKKAGNTKLFYWTVAACIALAVGGMAIFLLPSLGESDSGPVSGEKLSAVAPSEDNGNDHAPEEAVLTVSVFDFSDSNAGVPHCIEYPGWHGAVDESGAEETLAVSIDGDIRQGTFCYGVKVEPNNYVEYYYRDSDGGSFAVDSDGNLVQCDWNTTNTQGGELTSEECLEIAKDFLSRMVDVGLYQIESELDENRGEYAFVFTKYLGEYKTADCAKVYVTENGELSCFRATMLGRIPVDTAVPIDCEVAVSAAYEKLDALYCAVKDEYDGVEYELSPFVVTILDEGKTALLCYADVDCVDVSEDGAYELHRKEKIGLVIY